MSTDIHKRAAACLALLGCIALGAIFLTPHAKASHNDNEQYYLEIEEYTEWMRRNSSRLRSKINDLDDDPVNTFSIPILFGVTLSDITPNFGDPRGGGTRTHEGLDMHAPLGTPIVTPTDAVVLRTGNGPSSGRYVYTANPGNETFVYMHLSDIADIDSGDVIDAGELIGYVGDTGNANGVSHLHFEVRDDDGPTDPFDRIDEEYTLEEKMEFLDEILDDVRNEEELAEFLVETFSGAFLLAASEDIDVPRDIKDALEDADLIISADELGSDLAIGDKGNDVVTLQTFLISTNLGPAAERLAGAGATGYFGPITEAALIEYQETVGISPANGYFGPLTRSHMRGDADSVAEAESDSTSLGIIATLIPKDLDIGTTGPEVQILQLYLMIAQSGTKSRELFEAGATGYFGPITSAAFTEYQLVRGIPASGRYDLLTRAYIRENA